MAYQEFSIALNLLTLMSRNGSKEEPVCVANHDMPGRQATRVYKQRHLH